MLKDIIQSLLTLDTRKRDATIVLLVRVFGDNAHNGKAVHARYAFSLGYLSIYFCVVEQSPLRMLFRHIDLNDNEELDTYELQHFFHDIEPEEPVPDFDHLVHTMRRAMKLATHKKEQPLAISWQQFRNNYASLDTLTDTGAPEVRFFNFIFISYFCTIISNSIYLCWRMVLGRL